MEARKKMTLPTIIGKGNLRPIVTDEIYDFEFLAKQNFKDWYENGNKCEGRCAMFEGNLEPKGEDKKNRFTHIAMGKQELIQKLERAGIIAVTT